MSANLSTARVLRPVATCNSTNHQIYSNIDNTVTKKICTAHGKCDIDKVWIATAKAEERTMLLRRLKARGVGTAQMEAKYAKGGNKDNKANSTTRNSKVIQLELNDAIRKAVKDEKNIRKKRNKLRVKLEEELGHNPSELKSKIKGIKKQAQREKSKIKEKNRKKIEHLDRKFVHKKILQDDLPPNLQRYQKAKIYNKEEEFKPNTEDEVIVIGNINLSEDEKALLKRCPDFAVFSNLTDELHKVEVLAAGVKHRWETANTDDDEEFPDNELEERMKEIEAQSRMTYNPADNDINLGRQRATDCPGNTRVFLPKPMHPIKEAMIAVRNSEWNKIREEFKAKHTNDKGEQRSNLTPQELRGLKSLL